MEKEVEINGESEVYLCNLWTWCLSISYQHRYRVVCIMIKRSRLQFPINLHHLSLASLAWILKTLPSYQVRGRLSSSLLPSGHNCKTPKPELTVFPCFLLPPVLQPNFTSISGEQQTLIVIARSYWPQNRFQIGSIPQIYLYQIKTSGNI